MVMTIIEEGDLFASGAEVFVNPVNSVGTMGKGLAKVFANEFPDVLAEYKLRCRMKLVEPGRISVHGRKYPSDWDKYPNLKYVLNATTKRDWRDPSKISYVFFCITAISEFVDNWHINSIAIPALGCGLGGLKWDSVFPMLESIGTKERNTPCQFFVYPPYGGPT